MKTGKKILSASGNSNSSSENVKDGVEDEISTIVLPSNFIKCSRTDLAILISRMLTFLIQINDSSSKNGTCDVSGLTRFHSRIPPDISVYNYLIRLIKYSSLEHCVLLAAVYYIDLLSSVYPTFTLNSLTVHRFLLTATTVASKGLVDSFCTNTHYAKVGGVHCSELNLLECEFLKKINYRILPRDDNIDWCKLENKYHIFSAFEESEKDLIDFSSFKKSNSGENSGYNVLNTYYNKIVQLVGSYNSSTDKTKVINYTLPHFIQNINMDKKPCDNSNIHPFKDAIDDFNTTSRKRNLDESSENDFNHQSVYDNSCMPPKNKREDENNNNNSNTIYSTNKKHVTQQRLPIVSHAIQK